MNDKIPRYTQKDVLKILADYILRLETAMPIPLEDKDTIERIAEGKFEIITLPF